MVLKTKYHFYTSVHNKPFGTDYCSLCWCKISVCSNYLRETQATEERGPIGSHTHGGKTKGYWHQQKNYIWCKCHNSFPFCTVVKCVRWESVCVSVCVCVHTFFFISFFLCVCVCLSPLLLWTSQMLCHKIARLFCHFTYITNQTRKSFDYISLQKVNVTVRWHCSGIYISTGNICLHKQVGSKGILFVSLYFFFNFCSPPLLNSVCN